MYKHLLSIFKSIPYLYVLIGITMVSLFVKENFPFSDFPMYKQFSREPFYVFVTDKNRKPIPVEKNFLQRTGRLKKIYANKGLKDVAKKNKHTKRTLPAHLKEPLAKPALQWLWNNARPIDQQHVLPQFPLHLEEVWIDYENGEIKESTPEVIATLTTSDIQIKPPLENEPN